MSKVSVASKKFTGRQEFEGPSFIMLRDTAAVIKVPQQATASHLSYDEVFRYPLQITEVQHIHNLGLAKFLDSIYP